MEKTASPGPIEALLACEQPQASPGRVIGCWTLGTAGWLHRVPTRGWLGLESVKSGAWLAYSRLAVHGWHLVQVPTDTPTIKAGGVLSFTCPIHRLLHIHKVCLPA